MVCFMFKLGCFPGLDLLDPQGGGTFVGGLIGLFIPLAI